MQSKLRIYGVLLIFIYGVYNVAAQEAPPATPSTTQTPTPNQAPSPESPAPTVLDGVYTKEHYPERQPIPYAPLREADVFWAKRIWRVIPLEEKMNLPLKLPRKGDTKDRKSLMETIHASVLEGRLTAYNPIDDEFTRPYTMAEVNSVGVRKGDTTWVDDPNGGPQIPKVTPDEPLDPDKIVQFRLKEDWFFDKQRSVMDVRIIGIAPIMQKVSQETGEVVEGANYPVYWIYFPELRKILSNSEVFNRGNDAQRLTFDDLFQKRLFSSFVMKETNVYNRRIQDYKKNTFDQLIEAQRIKDDIFNFEHDLWEY